MAKYGDLIKQAKSGKPENQGIDNPEDPLKNLCVKVPDSWRRHWASQAKAKGKTMTKVIVEALKAEFGLPENLKTINSENQIE